MDDLAILNKIEEQTSFVQAGVSENPAALRGLILFYINVGLLPPHRAEGFIARYKEKTAPAFKHLESCYKVLYLPIREGETRVEFLGLPEVNE
jgi:hypothetical protein